jgi:hypothetical protein
MGTNSSRIALGAVAACLLALLCTLAAPAAAEPRTQSDLLSTSFEVDLAEGELLVDVDPLATLALPVADLLLEHPFGWIDLVIPDHRGVGLRRRALRDGEPLCPGERRP